MSALGRKQTLGAGPVHGFRGLHATNIFPTPLHLCSNMVRGTRTHITCRTIGEQVSPGDWRRRRSHQPHPGDYAPFSPIPLCFRPSHARTRTISAIAAFRGKTDKADTPPSHPSRSSAVRVSERSSGWRISSSWTSGTSFHPSQSNEPAGLCYARRHTVKQTSVNKAVHRQKDTPN